MKTRSQTRDFVLNIDFDEASIEWNKNKRKIENGCYKYICNYICKSGNLCKREPTLGNEYCSTHLTKRHS
jgi:hypothetical protein